MSFFPDWWSVLNSERSEIVFQNRNKEYGGYELRKNYRRRILAAIGITVAGIGLIVIIPVLASIFSKIPEYGASKISETINLEEPPPIDKATPPPPPIIPPPPVIQTIKFTPPKVVKDVEAEDPPPTQEEVKNDRISTETKEGIVDNVELPPELQAEPEEEKIFLAVEEMPSFPGGESKLFEFLRKHIKYPSQAKENEISGWVYLNFIIDKEGKIKDAAIVKGIGYGCDEEALRVVLAMPDWKPGRQNGRSVPVRSNIRVNFSLK